MPDSSSIYKAPFVDLESLDSYVPSLNREIVRVSIGDGMVFQFLQDLRGAEIDILSATFHGARDPKQVKLPYFVRATSMRKLARPHLLFSDPTMSLDEDNLRLCWYSGTAAIDIADVIQLVVMRAVKYLNSRAVQFEGSSGGGFMALRMAHLMPLQSAALAISPQVDAFAYENSTFADRTIKAVYPAEDLEQVKIGQRDRFDLRARLSRAAYTNRSPFLRYIQNESDVEHVNRQLLPFLSAHEIDYNPDIHRYRKERVDVLVQHHGDGHVAPPAGVWDHESDVLRSRLSRHLNNHAEHTSDISVSANGIPFEDGQYFVENCPTSEGVHYLVRNSKPTGSYIRVFFQSAAFRSPTDVGIAFRRASTPDPKSIADISVSDPTLRLDRALTAGWYLGNGPNPAYSLIAEHIAEFAAGRKLILIGQSVGGYAALQIAALLENAHATVFNPTMSLRTVDEGPAARLRAATGVSEAILSGSGRSYPVHDIVSTVRDVPLQRGQQASVFVARADTPYQRSQLPFIRTATAYRPDWLNVLELDGGIPALVEQERIASKEGESLDVGGSSSALFVSRHSASGVPKNRTGDGLNIAVYGGCVTRDTATAVISKLGGGDVVTYVARQSLISAGTSVSKEFADLNSLESRWQARRLLSDFEGRALKEIQVDAPRIDLLLFDFLMERHGVLQVAEGFVTPSYELTLAGGLQVDSSPIQLGTPEHFSLWTKSLAEFREFLVSVDMLDKAVLFAVPWANRAIDGGPSGHSEGMTSAVANILYVPYYEFAKELGFNIVSMPENAVTADPNNRWGLAPYHYNQEVYDELSDAIIDFVGQDVL